MTNNLVTSPNNLVTRLRQAAMATRTTERVICDQAADEIERLREACDAAYNERNRVVALLASLFPSGLKKTEIPGWDAAWHGCVYVDLPTGQASWHYHDRDAQLFSHLPAYDGEWDGHTTSEKYERVARAALGEEK